jgi:hypothetical protein
MPEYLIWVRSRPITCSRGKARLAAATLVVKLMMVEAWRSAGGGFVTPSHAIVSLSFPTDTSPGMPDRPVPEQNLAE